MGCPHAPGVVTSFDLQLEKCSDMLLHINLGLILRSAIQPGSPPDNTFDYFSYQTNLADLAALYNTVGKFSYHFS